MIFRGLIDYGYTDIAQELADKTFELVVSEADLREFTMEKTVTGRDEIRFGDGVLLVIL